MNVHAFLTILSFAVNFCLAAFILLRDPNARQNRIYAAFALCVTYWAIFKFCIFFAGSEEQATVFYKLSGPGWCLMPVFYLHFVEVFTGRKLFLGWRPAIPLLYAAGLFFSASCWADGLMLRRMITVEWGFTHEPGMLYKRLFAPFLLACFIYGAYYLARFAIKARAHDERMKAVFLLIGIFFPLVGGASTNMILPAMGIHPPELAIPLTSLNAAFIAVAVFRYGLLSITYEYAAPTIIKTMPDALFVLDANRKVELTNPAIARLVGEDAGRIKGRPFNELLAEPIFDEKLVEKIELEGVAVIEADVLSADRVRIPMRLSISPLRGKRNQTEGFVCVGKDIRDIKELISRIEKQKKDLEEISITDSLTGVFNRRYLSLRLREEFLRARRYEESFSVVVVDLDWFMNINDSLGHSAGDVLLRKVADIFRTHLRVSDVVTRFGGDEFVIILPQSDRQSASVVIGRIKDQFGRTAFGAEYGTVTASFGVSTFDPRKPAANEEELLKLADAALYRSKSEGRDRVTFAE